MPREGVRSKKGVVENNRLIAIDWRHAVDQSVRPREDVREKAGGCRNSGVKAWLYTHVCLRMSGLFTCVCLRMSRALEDATCCIGKNRDNNNSPAAVSNDTVRKP